MAILLLNASNWQVSMLAAVAGIAGVTVMLPAGPWIEFHRKRPTMITADLVRCATQGGRDLPGVGFVEPTAMTTAVSAIRSASNSGARVDGSERTR